MRLRIRSCGGISYEEARALLKRPYTSIRIDLVSKFPILADTKGVAGFAASDVIAVLGQSFQTKLDEAKIDAVTVPYEMAKIYGYKSSLVLVEQIKLSEAAEERIRPSPKMRIRQIRQPQS